MHLVESDYAGPGIIRIKRMCGRCCLGEGGESLGGGDMHLAD